MNTMVGQPFKLLQSADCQLISAHSNAKNDESFDTK